MSWGKGEKEHWKKERRMVKSNARERRRKEENLTVLNREGMAEECTERWSPGRRRGATDGVQK